MSASILVVVDEPVVQDTVKWLLHTQGYEVTTAGTGEEALTRIAQQEFDVMLSDIKMPGLNGLDVLERSRALKPREAARMLEISLASLYRKLGEA